MKRHSWLLLVVLLFPMATGPTTLFAQEDAPPGDKPSNGKASGGEDAASQPIGPGPKAQAWEAKLKEWRTLLADLRELREQYGAAKNEDLEGIRTQYDGLLAQGEKLLPQLKDAARAAFEEAPNEDRELARFMLKVAADEVRADHYESAFAEAQRLIEQGFEHPAIYNVAGIAAFGTNRIALAKKYLDKAAAADVTSEEGQETSRLIEEFDLVKLWDEEAKIREAEANADDLPRVKLTTTQGEIVLELFENEAPDTVGNFISLVKSGFYDGRLFHRVIGGFMAQTGCPKGDGSGGPGYRIYCECYEEDARNHFAGTLSMAHAGKDTGGSQFYMTFQPTPALNGRHTVFGRVVEGWDTLAKIQRYDPSGEQPKPPLDKIVEAEVLRDQGREYKPNKVK